MVERVYVLGAVGHWSLLRRRVDPGRPLRLAVHPFDHRQPDGRGFRVGTPRLTAGQGVRVALVDTGVARDHPDIVVAGGRNCVTGEDPADYGPNGHEHGTHVAGIVAGRGRAPSGRRGVAPGAELHSYRAFGQGQGEATSFAIAKALDAAVQDGCDVVNLSLGGGGADPVVRAAVEEAQESGLIVVAAAGNDGRAPVAFPADLPDVVAVSALGRTGTFPRTAGGAAERRGPYGRDGADFHRHTGLQRESGQTGLALVQPSVGRAGALRIHAEQLALFDDPFSGKQCGLCGVGVRPVDRYLTGRREEPAFEPALQAGAGEVLGLGQVGDPAPNHQAQIEAVGDGQVVTGQIIGPECGT